jgi:GT2 family glycosyltransferase
MDISVIIATYRRMNLLQALVRALVNDLPGKAEVIVVTQGRETLAVEDNRIKVLRKARPNLPAARNAGITAARGDILLFLDDDVLPATGLAQKHIELHARTPSSACIAGRVRDTNNSGTAGSVLVFDRRILRYKADFGREGEEEVESMCGAHMSFKRKVFDTLWFDPWYTGNALWEEVDMAMRMRKRGMKILFSSDVSVDHFIEHSGGCRAETRRAWYYHRHFRNTALCFAKNCSIATLREFYYTHKYDLEYYSRKGSGRDAGVVVAGTTGMVQGFLLGLLRRRIGSRKYR